MDILSLKNLSCRVDGHVLLQDVSLDIPKGSFVGVIGPNGSGKTTLLKTVYRAHKANGAIWLNGTDMNRLSARQIARQMAVVPQENQISFDFTVMQLMLTGLYSKRSLLSPDSPQDVRDCEEALEQVGMPEFKNRSFLSLSGGEKQRVLIAGAFARRPELIVLDEPTNHLDVGYQFLIMDIMKKRKDVTVFTSMHDMNMAMQYCDYLIALQGGRVYACGTPRQVLTTENLRKLFRVEARLEAEGDGLPYIRYTGYIP